MLQLRADLPLNRHAATRFVPWVIAVMVYLAALALAGGMLLGDATARWTAGLAGTITVQLMPNPAGKDATEADLKKALAVLKAEPGIVRAAVLGEAETRKLIEPWLGTAASADLPLPRLIDVSARSGGAVDLDELRRKLGEAVPAARLDSHRQWLAPAVDFARSVEFLALIILLLTVAAAVVAVIFAARSGLAAHQRMIEVLHFMGARDSFIARQFERQAMLQALIGGAIGLPAAVLTLLLVGWVAGDIAFFGLTGVRLGWFGWIAVILIVPVAATIATVTARITVLTALARLP